jgi:hypothetical protein
MKIFVCLIKQARLLAINSKLGGGRVDSSILWLSFAQQKHEQAFLLLNIWQEDAKI